jgi:hypothetical protein
MHRTTITKSAAAIAAAGALALAGACGSKTVTAHTATPIATITSIASSAPAVPVDTQPATSPMDDWCSGNGYSDFQAVETDMSQLSTDTGNNDLLAAEQDGSQLFQDAHAAGMNLPPGSNHQKLDYGLYMGFLMVAGAKISNGDINGAGDSMSKSVPYKSSVEDTTGNC